MSVISLQQYRQRRALLDELAELVKPPDSGARFFEHLTQGIEMSQRTYTVKQAAQILSIHPQTVRKLIYSGELKAAKFGQSYRLDREALQALWTAKGGGKLFTDDPDGDAEIFDEDASDD